MRRLTMSQIGRSLNRSAHSMTYASSIPAPLTHKLVWCPQILGENPADPYDHVVGEPHGRSPGGNLARIKTLFADRCPAHDGPVSERPYSGAKMGSGFRYCVIWI
jgi:hypothetical protein